MTKFLILVLILYLIFSYQQTKVRKKRSSAYVFNGDPYDVLGVSSNVSDEQIKAAYREQSRKNHPDLVSHMSKDFQRLAESKLKEINAAYEMIKSERKVKSKSNF